MSARERLEVLLDQPAELLDRPAADGRGTRGPCRAAPSRAVAAGLDERAGVAERRLGDDLVEVRGVRDREGAAWGVGGLAADQ